MLIGSDASDQDWWSVAESCRDRYCPGQLKPSRGPTMMDGPLTCSEIEAFRRDGFVVAKSKLPSSIIEAVQQEIEEVVAGIMVHWQPGSS